MPHIEVRDEAPIHDELPLQVVHHAEAHAEPHADVYPVHQACGNLSFVFVGYRVYSLNLGLYLNQQLIGEATWALNPPAAFEAAEACATNALSMSEAV